MPKFRLVLGREGFKTRARIMTRPHLNQCVISDDVRTHLNSHGTYMGPGKSGRFKVADKPELARAFSAVIAVHAPEVFDTTHT